MDAATEVKKASCKVIKELLVLEGSRHSQIRIRVVRWEGSKRSSFDIRKFFKTETGDFVPSGKGNSLDWDFLLKLQAAIPEAVELMRKEDVGETPNS